MSNSMCIRSKEKIIILRRLFDTGHTSVLQVSDTNPRSVSVKEKNEFFWTPA
jgi:hypothetical protein